MRKKPETIDQVLEELDKIIEDTVREDNFLGIFAYVYRRTTAEIKEGINDKRFQDNKRMEEFDVSFANYYIDAYYSYIDQQAVSKSWGVSFEARNKKIAFIQHLMMGMNAHINFDLGVAAYEAAKDTDIHEMKDDFMKVNEVLAELTNVMQAKLGKVSLFMFLLDWLGHRNDERIANFSMKKAREQAWSFACNLSSLSDIEAKKVMQEKDEEMAAFGNFIWKPPSVLLKSALVLVSFFERGNVKRVIEKLKEA